MVQGSRVSVRKKNIFKKALGQSEAAKRRRDLIQDCKKLLRKAHEEELLSVKSLLTKDDGNSSDGTEARFPRQVAMLGGPPPKCVPNYVKAQVLSKLTGVPPRFFLMKGMREDTRGLYQLAVGQSTTAAVPERGGKHSRFVKWSVKLHKVNGSPMKKYDVTQRPYDWNHIYGAIFALPSKCGKYYDKFQCRRTKEIVTLKKDERIPMQDYGRAVYLYRNWCLAQVRIKFPNPDDTIKIGKRFKEQDP